MKKINLVVFLLICIVLLATGCNNSIGKSPEEEWEGLNESWDGQVMVKDGLYFYTSYKVPVEIEKKAILGKIKSVVGNYDQPSQNEEANLNIKGSKYVKYQDNVAVQIDKKWYLFMNQDDWTKDVTIEDVGFLDENLGDEKALELLHRIIFSAQMDDNHKNNLDKIIDEAFIYCEIDDSSLLEEAKSKLIITVSDK